MNEKKIVKRYNEEFKRQAVELLIHSGKRQAQVARELGVSDYTLTLWKRAYLGQLKPAEVEIDYYATFTAKLSLEGNKVYVDCPTLSVTFPDKRVPVKHVMALNIHDINYDKLKAEAAKGKTVEVNGRFNVDDDGKMIFMIANSKGKR